MLVAAAVLARQHHRLAHPGVLAKPRDDLTRLDAVAANLHLIVVAAQELKIAVRQITGKVAGPVQPIALDKGTGDEPLGGQLRAVQVAPCHPRPANVKLADRTERHGRAMAIQQVHPRVDDWTPDVRHLGPT
ncbi:hypothetical protein ABIE87_003396 [Bradyrhizobium diazoefficiens]